MICRKAMLSKKRFRFRISISYIFVCNMILIKWYLIVNLQTNFSAPLDLDYFEEAVDLLQNRDEVQKERGLGLIGISKSGDIVLEMAAFFPSSKIKAVVAMNCMPNALVTDVDYKGKRVLSGKYKYRMLILNLLL